LLVGKLVKSNKLIYCIGSQIVGAILGSLICKIFGSLVFAFFHKTSAFYVAVPTFFDIFKDAIGEFVGTFIFLFGILHI
jgi:glycerol uptake facilitator-like aquaporin